MGVLTTYLRPMKAMHLSWLLLIFLSTNFPGNGNPVVLVSGQCQRDQQSLLLQMKNSLIFDSTLSVGLVQWNQSTDCCTWSGVDCDMAGRVIGLDLSDESISGGIDNSSGLFGLQHLQRLNLAFNPFELDQIPSKLANLTNLTYLNLTSYICTGQIPIVISHMTRLVTLDLSCTSSFGARLKNPNLKALVQNLSELRELHLDGVDISANGTEWGQALSSSLPNLQVLSLNGCNLSGPIHSSLADLRSLSIISLDGNSLSSPIPDFFTDFPNLKILSLNRCNLSGKLPENIFKVSTLHTLLLRENPLLHGSLSDFALNNSFQTLSFRHTNLSGTLPDSIGNLRSVSTLDLGGCNFTGPLPKSMANLTQLVDLDLSSNHFSGPIPYFYTSKSLFYIDLSSNFFNGSIHPALFVLPNASSSVLETLDLSGNRLEGPIPESIFELKNLKELSLSLNKFNGTLQLDMIGRLGNLTHFDLSYNYLAVNVSNSFSSFPPNLSIFRLASCNLSMIPNLRNIQELEYLDLSDNQISGDIPNWIWQVVHSNLDLSHNNLVDLEKPYLISDLLFLNLRYNLLQGKVPIPIQKVRYVDYSNNNFNSSIPDDTAYFFSGCMFFSISNNQLTGVIPESMCNASYLQVLDLSSNNLSGRIPTCLVEGGENLVILNLKYNRLLGTIPDRFPINCALQTLSFNGNQLEGIVPKSLSNCAMLEVLDFGNNNINDVFPCWLKNVSNLHVLVFRSNKFYGDISCIESNVSWPLLQIVDLAFNNFIGRLPKKGLTNWKAMMVDEHKAQSPLKHTLYFPGKKKFYKDAIIVTVKDLEMKLVKILTIFTSIDLSSNNFQGSIPEELGLFKSLHYLNLSHNALTGLIPSSIGNFKQLESLDLSMNNLQGHIPTQLANLNFLSVLNLSYNHLVGRIPTSTQLQSFPPTSFEGNEGLRGPPLEICSNSTQIPLPSNKFDPIALPSSNEFNWQFSLVIGVGFGTGFVTSVAPLIFSDKVNLWYDILIHKFLRRFCI